ncbi:FliH/SctL family protein [Buchnera aphidicola]|uniref:Flagellar assembly protein FliH n=1 Tax=Buchnera aphidicola (Aphis nerii) TaxID=1241835 RepID=A0A4D6XSP1_9GAMM|nr:FliH/SctL family protein [Buchnera aphidicola]QCI18639.1 flagellar assembly protein FliH [Buchnera aphidicola (Aphis nerii)]
MSNLDVKKDWKKWYPEEISLNHPKKNYNVFWNISTLKESDFYVIKKPKLNHKFKESNQIKDNFFKNESYLLNIKKNLIEKEKKYVLLNKNLKDLCVNFESTITLFEKTLFSRLLKTTLIICSYIIGEKISINESSLLKKVNKIVKNDDFFLKKPKLVIHPSNKKIFEKILKQSINNKWEFIYSENIDINGFKIQSENSNIDSTINARWKEVYRMILEEEKN